MKKAISQRDKEILDFCKNYLIEHKYAPSYEEIGKGTGISSKSTMYAHVKKLIRLGELESDVMENSPRAIRPKGVRVVTEEEYEKYKELEEQLSTLQKKELI